MIHMQELKFGNVHVVTVSFKILQVKVRKKYKKFIYTSICAKEYKFTISKLKKHNKL